MRTTPFVLSGTILLVTHMAMADGTDPAAARALLQQGYALKQQGKCDEALPRFLESVRLDRQLKGLVNLADCEQKLGKLASAQAHFVEVRDMARAQRAEPLRVIAEQNLQAIEKRMPKLTVQLAKDAPAETTVMRDGVELGRVSIGTPLPLDPGGHAILARGGGFQREYRVTLGEGETKTLEITPIGGTPMGGTPMARSEPAEKKNAEAAVPAVAENKGTAAAPVVDTGTQDMASSGSSFWSGQRVAALAAAGVGLAGMGVSFALVQSAKSSWKEAADRCPGGECTNADDLNQIESARATSNVATGVFIGGAACVALGGVLWFTAPRERSAAFSVAPTVGFASAGVTLRGQF